MKLQNVFYNLDGAPVAIDPTGDAQTPDGCATSVDTLNGFGVSLAGAVFASPVRKGSQRCRASLASGFSGWLLVLAADAKKGKARGVDARTPETFGPETPGSHNSDYAFARRKDRRLNRR